MSKEKKNIIQVVILLIVLVLVIILAVKVLNKDQKDIKQNEENKNQIAGIDINSEFYEGKKVYKKDGDIIIEDENGGQTIQTTKTKEDTGLEEITQEEAKAKYELLDVKVTTEGSMTVIRGKIKNNDKKEHKVVVNSKFYSQENKVKGATSTKVTVGKGETKEFSMSIMDEVANYRHEIKVEYAD